MRIRRWFLKPITGGATTALESTSRDQYPELRGLVRIAQVAPLYESVPPKLYGGTERVVSYLTEELVAEGHEVTLFASGDSDTSARLVAPCRKALRLDHDCHDRLAYHILLLEQVYQMADEFDIIHFHCDYLHFSLSRRQPVTHVTTLHGRLDLPELVPIYREFADTPVVSISKAQREPLPWVNWVGTVHHGLPDGLYRYRTKPGEYLAFLGRISPEKGLDQAIELAKRTGTPLKIAAKVDAADREYFESVIKPLLEHPLVELIGEIGEKEKDEFLGDALALVSPVAWPEPFGLVFIEALACGTPVITYRRGSVPEIIQHGVTGYVVSGMKGAVAAVSQLGNLNRWDCRSDFERRFRAARMRRDYERIYETLLQKEAEVPLLGTQEGEPCQT
jgi:glycosyltransferase involved in cell wall biosynthesis